MKTMTTLGQVSERVDELSRNCHDRMIVTREIAFEGLETVLISGEPHYLQRVAQKAISTRLGIPWEYLNRCPAEVQAYNLNHWLKHERNPELFFRFDGGEVRAIFTPRYKPVDNFEVLYRLSTLGYGPDTRVQCHLDREFLSLSIPDGSQAFVVNGKDRIVPGVSIANSEVGISSLKIAAFFLRLQCTNGLIAKTEMTTAYRHVSRKILTDFPQVMQEVSSQVSRQRDKFRISLDSRVDDPQATMQAFNRQFQLAKEEIEAVMWGYHDEPSFTMFHIVNAYTRAAAYPGIAAEASYRLQRIGGNILAMVK
jgi:hypothetical protein